MNSRPSKGRPKDRRGGSMSIPRLESVQYYLDIESTNMSQLLFHVQRGRGPPLESPLPSSRQPLSTGKRTFSHSTWDQRTAADLDPPSHREAQRVSDVNVRHGAHKPCSIALWWLSHETACRMTCIGRHGVTRALPLRPHAKACLILLLVVPPSSLSPSLHQNRHTRGGRKGGVLEIVKEAGTSLVCLARRVAPRVVA